MNYLFEESEQLLQEISSFETLGRFWWQHHLYYACAHNKDRKTRIVQIAIHCTLFLIRLKILQPTTWTSDVHKFGLVNSVHPQCHPQCSLVQKKKSIIWPTTFIIATVALNVACRVIILGFIFTSYSKIVRSTYQLLNMKSMSRNKQILGACEACIETRIGESKNTSTMTHFGPKF